MPTNLSAVVSGKTLMVSGEAAQSLYSQVSITRGYDSVEVKDNGTVGVLVPIQGMGPASTTNDAQAREFPGFDLLPLAGRRRYGSRARS